MLVQEPRQIQATFWPPLWMKVKKVLKYYTIAVTHMHIVSACTVSVCLNDNVSRNIQLFRFLFLRPSIL